MSQPRRLPGVLENARGAGVLTRAIAPHRLDCVAGVLNRHYILHGMDASNFYPSHDLHRLLLAFDLLVDLVAMINGTYRSRAKQAPAWGRSR